MCAVWRSAAEDSSAGAFAANEERHLVANPYEGGQGECGADHADHARGGEGVSRPSEKGGDQPEMERRFGVDEADPGVSIANQLSPAEINGFIPENGERHEALEPHHQAYQREHRHEDPASSGRPLRFAPSPAPSAHFRRLGLMIFG